MAVPFLMLRDDGVRYVISRLEQETQSQELPVTAPTVPAQAPSVPSEPKGNLWERVLFIGDSRTCGLRDYAPVDGADYFCEVGMTVFNVRQKRLSDRDFQQRTLEELLAERKYSCVVIGLGINECGYPLESLMDAYKGLVQTVSRAQPDGVIVLQGILAVGRGWVSRGECFLPENLSVINGRICALADGVRIRYIDPNARFCDEAGYLPDSMTGDGCHLYAKYASLWSDWIREALEEEYADES